MRWKAVKNSCTRSVSRQLMLGIAFTHAVLMTIFVFDLVERQREFMVHQSQKQAISLAETLAANGTSWMLASDFIGMEEVIASQSGFPGLKYAIFIDLHNKVLGYTDRQHVGRYLRDPVSDNLQLRTAEVQIMVDTPRQIDVAAPIMVNDRHIGWARVGVDRSNIVDNLELVTRNGLGYTLLAIVVGTVFAWLMARGMTMAIRKMAFAAHAVSEGEQNVDFKVDRVDELGGLSHDFEAMVTILAEQETELKTYQGQLEEQVANRTEELQNANDALTIYSDKLHQKNSKLEQAYEKQKRLQTQLIESEKMSALGALVSGVSHEINTPLGISYTGISGMHDRQVALKAAFDKGVLSKKTMTDYLVYSEKMMHTVMNSLERATEVITSFRQITVAQSVESSQQFCLNNYLKDILLSIDNKLKREGVEVSCELEQEILVTSDPGLFVQFLTHLLMNSIVHGFTSTQHPKIVISAEITNDELLMVYQDNGGGMDEQQVKKQFDPFYTTKMGTGGSGLGMHVVYNIITQGLQGEIHCQSQVGEGVTYHIRVPVMTPMAPIIQ